MNPESMNEKTAVFSFGSLAVEEPRSYDTDEPTRELPLIAGRFAGREWVVEDLQREYDAKREARADHKRKSGLVSAVSGALAVTLLAASLLSQAKLVDVNEEVVSAAGEIAELRQEQNALRVRYAQTGLALRVDENDPDTVWVRETAPAREEKATVLNVRRGHELQHLWNSVVDILGESFH